MSPTLIVILILGFIVLIAGGFFLFGLINTLIGGSDLSERIENYALIPETNIREGRGAGRFQLIRFRLRLNSMLSIFTSQELNSQLISANWPVTETEFALIRFGLSFVGLILGWLVFGSLLSGIGFAAITYLLPGIYLKRSISQRRLKFSHQLVDALLLVSGGVRAGYSLLQALDLVIEEMLPPASEEFRRVRREVGLGFPLSEALNNLAIRMENDDLDLVVTAININTQVGGNLATMLNAVTETIRERIRLFSEVRSLTAQQRNTGYLLTVFPFIIGAILFILNPTYMARLFQPGQLLCVPIGAIVGIILGNIIIQRMVKIEV